MLFHLESFSVTTKMDSDLFYTRIDFGVDMRRRQSNTVEPPKLDPP